MATEEYVDAGQAVANSSLSGIVGSAPPVTDGVTYERDGLVWVWRPEAGQRAAASHTARAISTSSALGAP